ncbi:unnamed protein product [Ectocarpus sp. 12 AP-2014]
MRFGEHCCCVRLGRRRSSKILQTRRLVLNEVNTHRAPVAARHTPGSARRVCWPL